MRFSFASSLPRKKEGLGREACGSSYPYNLCLENLETVGRADTQYELWLLCQWEYFVKRVAPVLSPTPNLPGTHRSPRGASHGSVNACTGGNIPHPAQYPGCHQPRLVWGPVLLPLLLCQYFLHHPWFPENKSASRKAFRTFLGRVPNSPTLAHGRWSY